MPDLRAHFEARAAALSDCSTLEEFDRGDGSIGLALVPNVTGAVAVEFVPYPEDGGGWIRFDDPSDPGDDYKVDVGVIDYHIDAAVAGRVKSFRGPRRRSMIEVSTDNGPMRSHYYPVGSGLMPRPGWRHRATVIDYAPYRD